MTFVYSPLPPPAVMKQFIELLGVAKNEYFRAIISKMNKVHKVLTTEYETRQTLWKISKNKFFKNQTRLDFMKPQKASKQLKFPNFCNKWDFEGPGHFLPNFFLMY